MSEGKKPLDQAALRRLMAEAKSSRKRPEVVSSSSSSLDKKLKKYKISKREELLIEEAKSTALSDKSSLPKGFFDAKPAKSILKNSSSYVPPPQPYLAYNPPTKKPKESEAQKTEEELNAQDEDDTPNGELPKGFFDDPIKDAKARQVEYQNPEDLEWEKFKKEISIEINNASEIAAEDQVEATTDRQLEEIEDQMSAWHRVAKMEKERDQIGESLNDQAPKLQRDSSGDSSDEDDVDLDELMNWRNKC